MNFGAQEMKGKRSDVQNGTLMICTASESVQMFRSFNDMQIIGTVWPSTMVTALGPPSNVNGSWMVPVILEGLAALDSLQPAPAQPPREDLLDAVFKACDITQDGVLTTNEMYRFARCLDFPGSEKDFDKEFTRLCTRWGEESNIGLREDAFLRCMNDPESYYFCSDVQLSSMLMMLPNGLTRVGLVTDIFRTCDQNGNGKLTEIEMLRFARALGFPGTDRDWANEFRSLCEKFGDGDLAGVDLCTFRRIVNRRDGDYFCTEGQLASIKSAVSWDLSLSSGNAPRSRMRDHSPFGRALGPKTAQAPVSKARTQADALCRCGAIIPSTDTSCLQCGCDRPVNVKDCRECSLVLPANVAYCPRCGRASNDPAEEALLGKSPRGIAGLFGRKKADGKSTPDRSESPAPSSSGLGKVVLAAKAKAKPRSASPRGLAGIFGRRKKADDKSTSPAPSVTEAVAESPAPSSPRAAPSSPLAAPSSPRGLPASSPATTKNIDGGTLEHTLRIKIVSASGLRRGDWICFCEGIPESTGLRIKTPSKNSTAKPIWDFSGDHSLTQRVESLMFVVYDSFLTSEESRFVAMLDRSHIYPDGFESDTMKLEGRNNNATLSVKVEVIVAGQSQYDTKTVPKKRGLFKLFGAKKGGQQPDNEQAAQADAAEQSPTTK